MRALLRSRQNTETNDHHFLHQHVDVQYSGIDYRSISGKEGTLNLGCLFLDEIT
jgi:hypothetical protein